MMWRLVCWRADVDVCFCMARRGGAKKERGPTMGRHWPLALTAAVPFTRQEPTTIHSTINHPRSTTTRLQEFDTPRLASLTLAVRHCPPS